MRARLVRCLLAAAAAVLAAGDVGEVHVRLPKGGYVALSTAGPSAFRARFVLPRTSENGTIEVEDSGPIATPMVRPDSGNAAFYKVTWATLGADTSCRVDRNDTSVDGLGSTKNKTARSLDECKAICEQASGCTGIEWSENDDSRRCEFWTVSIGHIEWNSTGQQCFNFTKQDKDTSGIYAVGLGSVSVSPKGELMLRGADGTMLTQSEALHDRTLSPQAPAETNHPAGFFQGVPGAEQGNEQIWSGDVVQLQAETGRFIEAQDDQVRARWYTQGEWQRFIIQNKRGFGQIRHNDIVFLHTHLGSAVDAHNNHVQARWNVHGKWQELKVERLYGGGVLQEDNRIQLRTSEGQYIRVKDEKVEAAWQTRGLEGPVVVPSQIFKIKKAEAVQTVHSGETIFLQDHAGEFLTSSAGRLLSRPAARSAEQRWLLQKVGGQPHERISAGDSVYVVDLEGRVAATHAKKKGGPIGLQAAGQRGAGQQFLVERPAGPGALVQGDIFYLRSTTGQYISVFGNVAQASSTHNKTARSLKLDKRMLTCAQTVALNGTLTASSEQEGAEAWRGSDADDTTAWMSQPRGGQWFSLDLEGTYNLSRVEVNWDDERYARTYFVESSSDGQNWTTLSLALGHPSWVVSVLPFGSSARYVRVRGQPHSEAKQGIRILEMKVHLCQETLALSSRGGALYGRGGSPYDAYRLTAKANQPMVCNRATFVPYYYSGDGYGALGVIESSTNSYSHALFPVSYLQDGDRVSWGYTGNFDLYLMPAKTLAKGTSAYYHLTGRPRVPPRHAFGFLASRWGWENRSYIERTLANFQAGRFPVDNIILDFEWFTNESDFGFSSLGMPWYQDFGFNNRTLPAPKEQLLDYRNKFNVRMGGIRKPRLGNTHHLEKARASGWLLPGGAPGGQYPPDFQASRAYGRNLDFSKQDVRDWYSMQLKNLLDTGVDFWWNDEGETNYFTYFWWNLAQLKATKLPSPMVSTSTTAQPIEATVVEPKSPKRFFSLNRAFTPGLARLGGTVWTGDIEPSWHDLAHTPGIMLNWVLAGAPYVSCDIGGFLGETDKGLLSRWMQMGVFLPMMRVHSWLWATPHWPWKFGPEAAVAIRRALELRYQLVPYHYSLAHGMYNQGDKLWIRPMELEFPDDESMAGQTRQWMDGELLVAPVWAEDSRQSVYLPEGTWYHFNDTRVEEGPTHLNNAVDATKIPVFVRPGAIIALAPVVQSTDLLPGGPLEVQIYGGADGSFKLVEDDGESIDYEVGRVRETTLRWYDAACTLSWRARGAATNQSFKELQVVLFDHARHKDQTPLPSVRLKRIAMKDGGSISCHDSAKG